jgi:hypothetical protein
MDGGRQPIPEDARLMFEVKVKLDLTGQMAKSAILRKVPAAFKRNATDWGSQTIRYIMKSYKGGNVFKRPPNEIDRNLAYTYTPAGDGAILTLGTGGFVGKNPVIYAKIQEEGGTTHPRVTDRMRKWAWAMHYKGFRSEIKGLGLRGATKRGAWETWRGIGDIYKGIALTKQSQLTVKLKARHWFSRPIGERRPELDRIMAAESVWATASKMAEKSGAGG